MKAQMKAVMASAVVIVLALAAVSGVTYSWFSDSEKTDITISVATVDIEMGDLEWDSSGQSTIVANPNGDGFKILNLMPGSSYGTTVVVSNHSSIETKMALKVEFTKPDNMTDVQFGYLMDNIIVTGCEMSTLGTHSTPYVYKESGEGMTYPLTISVSTDYSNNHENYAFFSDMMLKISVEAYQSDAPIGGSTDVGEITASSNSAEISLPTLNDESDYGPITISGIQNPINNNNGTNVIIDFDLKSSKKLSETSLNVTLLPDTDNIGAELILQIMDGNDSTIGNLEGEAQVTITSTSKDYPIYYLSDGNFIKMDIVKIVTTSNGYDITYKTNHFSEFAVLKETPTGVASNSRGDIYNSVDAALSAAESGSTVYIPNPEDGSTITLPEKGTTPNIKVVLGATSEEGITLKNLNNGHHVVGAINYDGTPATKIVPADGSDHSLTGTITGSFDNILFEGYNGARWTYCDGTDLTYNNCVFKGEIYGYHVDSATGSTITFNDCTFIGFNAFAATGEKYVFNNCSFKHNGSYGHTNMWSEGYFNDCVFEDLTSVSPKGDVGKLFFDNVEESYHHEFIGSKESLISFADSVNVGKDSWAGQKVILVNDIDLGNDSWTPIGQTGSTEFKGIFDGQNHTIYNLKVDSSDETGGLYSSGLFGWAESSVTIQNVRVEGAVVTGNHNVAVIVGYTYSGKISNCHVSNANIVCNHANDDACGDKCGIIVGYAGDESRISDCSATDCTVTAGRDAGQLVGTGYNVSMNNCSATNVIVSANGDCTGANVNNTIIGRIMG